ncbi:MAG: uracil-DNA glycosylase [bacterium]|nr:uracil-DNA glycosylase [bacterium]
MKLEALQNLKKEIEENKSLSLQEANLVFGEGSPDAEIIFIGEAPGYYEDLEKRPFVGRSGQLLTVLVKSIGIRRENVYITNIVKRRPPENRDPLPEEISLYSPYLIKQVEIIGPKIIATLGRFSMNFFLPFAKISRDQGKSFLWNEKIIMPLYHPAAALRSTAVKKELEESFIKLKAVLENYSESLKKKPVVENVPEKKDGAKKQMGLF